MVAKTITAAASFDWKYDVFLSFRGEDTRNNFTGHLYKALDRKGLGTFMDMRSLEQVKRNLPHLLHQFKDQGARSLFSQKIMHLPSGVWKNLWRY